MSTSTSLIDSFIHDYGDDVTCLPCIDPIRLPCGHLISNKYISILRETGGFFCPKRHLSIKEASFSPDQTEKLPHINVYIEQFVQKNRTAFCESYETIKARSDKFYENYFEHIRNFSEIELGLSHFTGRLTHFKINKLEFYSTSSEGAIPSILLKINGITKILPLPDHLALHIHSLAKLIGPFSISSEAGLDGIQKKMIRRLPNHSTRIIWQKTFYNPKPKENKKLIFAFLLVTLIVAYYLANKARGYYGK